MSRLAELVDEQQPAAVSPTLTVDASPDGGEFAGMVTTAPIKPGDYEGAFARVYELAGLNPAEYRIVEETVRFRAYQQSAFDKVKGERNTITLYAYGARFQRISAADAATEDLAPLMAIAKANARRKPPAKPRDLTRVVVISDAQVGKVGSRGGTPELLIRVAGLLAQLDAIMVKTPCADAVIVDPGDLCEGFENVAAQRFTNDLSHPSQLRVARAILTDVVTAVASRHKQSRVLTVPSNHTAWRSGKEVLGRPADDYGIDVHRAVHEALSRDRRFSVVTWEFPDEWDDSLAFEGSSQCRV